ncbi:MAG TPA: hypothetical protein VF494_01035 [Candidatus Limnocylindrales bacterium]
MRSKSFLVGACLVVATIVAGCGAGTVSPNVQTGHAVVNGAGDGGTIETSDWNYGLPTSGVTWVDGQGASHDGGRPDCLAPGTSRDIRFAAVNVQVGSATWRAVVWVSCQ